MIGVRSSFMLRSLSGKKAVVAIFSAHSLPTLKRSITDRKSARDLLKSTWGSCLEQLVI